MSNKIASELLDLIHLNYRRVNCIVRNALRDYNKEIIVLILKIFHENVTGPAGSGHRKRNIHLNGFVGVGRTHRTTMLDNNLRE